MEIPDITKLTSPEQTFDLIMCSNVLEHISDDGAVLSEVILVLSPGGTCVLVVQLWRAGDSYHDFSITSPEYMKGLFGQPNHIRLYGLEAVTRRIRNAGFGVETINVRDFDTCDVARYGMNHLTSWELFLCTS